MSRSERRVVLVSPLPPPAGGVASWTNIVKRRGLGDGWRASIVNSRMIGRTVADERLRVFPEVIRTVRVISYLIYLLVTFRPDIVHLNSSMSGRGVFRDALVVGLARLTRVPILINLRGNFLPGKRPVLAKGTRWAYTFIFRASGKIVVLNLPSRDGVLELGEFSEKTSVMPNFVDVTALPEKGPADRERFRAAYLGALIDSKGLGTIVEAAAQMPEYDFTLVGDIPAARDALHTQLLSRAESLGNIEMTGALPHQAALARLAASDVLILPSRSEGFPNAVAEAMAIGMPVVASPVGAIPEMVDEGKGGFLIPTDRPDDYVSAIRRLHMRPELVESMGQYNRNKARELYSYERVIEQWHRAYMSLL